MEDIPENLINAILKLKLVHDWIKQGIDEQKRRNLLRKGSIDVEYRVLK